MSASAQSISVGVVGAGLVLDLEGERQQRLDPPTVQR